MLLFLPIPDHHSSSSFYMYTDLHENRDGLSLSIDGDTLNSPTKWMLTGTQIGGEAITATLVAEKGPRFGMDRYKPVSIYLESKV